MEIKRKILAKTLQNAIFDGWNDSVLEESGLQTALQKNEIYIHFPSGISDLVDFFAAENLAILESAADSLNHNEKLPAKITF